jgi:UTP--glucose-1-phosphate uridylyltransferase
MFPVIIPAAGYGTRSLPASKAIPKEMLTIFDKPTIQYVVEEVVRSGLDQVIFVTSRGKSAIEDHFDVSAELEAVLERSKKFDLLEMVRGLSKMVSVQSVRQKEMLGLGHAVLMAKHLVSTTHFGCALGDDLIEAPVASLKQLIDFAQKRKLMEQDAGVVLLMNVPQSDVGKYGICELDPQTGVVTRCVEKPKAGETSSRLAIVGRYFLPRSIFDLLEGQRKGALGEIQLTDGLNALAQKGKLYGHVLEGQRFDAGDRLGFLEATLFYALRSPLKDGVRKLMKEMQ